MRAAIFASGTELTRGERTNTNAAWLAEKLTELGVDIMEMCTVADDEPKMIETLNRLAKEADVILSTGGLGPTSDDLTRQVAAQLLGVALEQDDETLATIRARFTAMGKDMPSCNTQQAQFPKGATRISNPVGTAPGFSFQLHKAEVFCLPGVPAEMSAMFDETVLPYLATKSSRTSFQVHLLTLGLTESLVAERLRQIEREERNVVIGYRARLPEVEVKVLANEPSLEESQNTAERVAKRVEQALDGHVFGGKNARFAEELGKLLKQARKTLAIAESCTGGGAGALLASVPGSSEYFLMSAVTYANESKKNILGVREETLKQHGAVSAQVAQEMADGVLRVSSADMAVSITGIAGPDGGSAEKPVGTVYFALTQKGLPTQTELRRFVGARNRIQTLASYHALYWVWRTLKHPPPGP